MRIHDWQMYRRIIRAHESRDFDEWYEACSAYARRYPPNVGNTRITGEPAITEAPSWIPLRVEFLEQASLF